MKKMLICLVVLTLTLPVVLHEAQNHAAANMVRAEVSMAMPTPCPVPMPTPAP